VIKVGGVEPSATPELLRSFFEFHGQILRAVISGSNGYIEFADSSAAQSALLFDRCNFVGKAISVELSDPPDPWPTPKEETAPTPTPTPTPAAAPTPKSPAKSEKSPAKGDKSPAAAPKPTPKPVVKQESKEASGSEEEFEKVTMQDATPPPAEPPVKAGPGTCGGLTLASLAEIPSLACFKAVLAEPINDVHAVLGVTMVGLAALALY